MFQSFPCIQIYASPYESWKINASPHESQRFDTSPTLCILIYTSISNSIELFVIYSNIQVTKNHRQSLQIIKSYPILLDPLENEQPLGVIFIDYVEKERTITGAYYAALLDRLVNDIRKKRPHL